MIAIMASLKIPQLSKILFGEAAVRDAARCEAVQVLESFEYALAR
jgi:hypothetical protein